MQGAQAVTPGAAALASVNKRQLTSPGKIASFKDWLRTDPQYPGRIWRNLIPAGSGGRTGIDAPCFDETVLGFEKWNIALNTALCEINYTLVNYQDVNKELAKDNVTFAALLCSAIMEPFVGHLEAGRIYEYFRNNVASSLSNTPPPGARNPPTVQSSTNAIKAAHNQAGTGTSNPFLGLLPKSAPNNFMVGQNGKLTFTGTGCVCKKCNTSNEYAAPNQDDGTYICFGCR